MQTHSMDAVQQANPDYPGIPMIPAPLAFPLWDRILKYNPANPDWPNRDRFLPSAGQASMLRYRILHGGEKTQVFRNGSQSMFMC